MTLAWFVAGVVLGALAAALILYRKLAQVEAARQVAETRVAAADASAAKINETIQSLSDAALRSNQASFLENARTTLDTVRAQITGDLAQQQTAVTGVVRAMSETIQRLEAQSREIESARQKVYGGLQQQIERLSRETSTLSNALRAPQVRGRWGETTLRRVVELAGMVKHCDFVEQEALDSGRLRPDMVVMLPGGRSIAVDAKVPLAAFLDAAAAEDDARRRDALKRHSQHVAEHAAKLGAKAYWSQLQPSPELVVLFLPGDHFLSAALEFNPTLADDALERKVLLATPATLISVLKGVSYDWRQHQLAESAEEIRRLASELYERTLTVQDYYADTGRHLDRAVQAYNRSVGSWENRLLPSLRRIRELGAAAGEEPAAPEQIDVVARDPKMLEPFKD
jgi:DNA recombination protein RmuC